MNAISWFEIPTTDLDRAERFYGTVLGAPLQRETFGGKPMSIFQHERTGVGGCLLLDKARKPASEGALLYLPVKDLDGALARSKQAGGDVVLPRTSIGEHGFIALVQDTEGNTIGLHMES